MDQTETTKLQVSSILSDCGDDILSPSALAFVEKIAMRFSAAAMLYYKTDWP